MSGCRRNYILLIHVNVPLGWNVMVYLGCRALKSILACLLILVMITLATQGESSSSASLGPSRNSRVNEWAPSQPMRRFPISLVPSVNVAVTVSVPVTMEATFLPHYFILSAETTME